MSRVTGMRIRNIKPDFFKSERLAELPIGARYLFEGLWLLADCDGRLEDRPKWIKAEVFPYDPFDKEVERWLVALDAAGHIQRYVIDDERFISLPKFRVHQGLRGREAYAQSDIPAPPPRPRGQSSNSQLGGFQRNQNEFREASAEVTRNHRREGKNPSDTGKDPSSKEAVVSVGNQIASVVPPLAELECTSGKTWALTEPTVGKLRAAYPAVDIEAEAFKAIAWLDANPDRRPTAKGAASFFHRWCSKAQNDAAGLARQRPLGFKTTAERQIDSAMADVQASRERERVREWRLREKPPAGYRATAPPEDIPSPWFDDQEEIQA